MQSPTVREKVFVLLEDGTSFHAEAEVNAETLDPKHMPVKLAGVITKIVPEKPGANTLTEEHKFTCRTSGGSSHTIWFFGKRCGYRLTRATEELAFTAELSVNPVTDLPGLNTTPSPGDGPSC
jgi:hypothetical protein